MNNLKYGTCYAHARKITQICVEHVMNMQITWQMLTWTQDPATPLRSSQRGGAPPAHAPGPLATWQPGPIAPAPHPAPVGSLLDLVAAVRSRRFLTFKHRACSNYHNIFKFFVCKKRFHVCSCSLMFSMFSACSGHVRKP